MNTYFRIFLQGLTKFIMMWMLRIHNLSNDIHIEWIQQNKNILRRKFTICWTMIALNQAKVNGVHLAFLCQNLMEHIGCAPITGRSIIWVKHFTDTFHIPRMDDCIDKIGNSKYITKFDLLKGFWRISLTERAKEISAFVTPDGLYHYKVMPFGMKNSPATFQRLINTIIAGIEHCEAYIDDAIIYNDEWSHHLGTIKAFFDNLNEAKLTINLAKSEFCHATLTFLGHVVGHG